MGELQTLVNVQGVRRIIEMTPFPQALSGAEELLIDSGDTTHKITVDALLGYIANRILLGDIPPIELSKTIVEIQPGEELPESLRTENTFYLNIQESVLEYPSYYSNMTNRANNNNDVDGGV